MCCFFLLWQTSYILSCSQIKNSRYCQNIREILSKSLPTLVSTSRQRLQSVKHHSNNTILNSNQLQSVCFPQKLKLILFSPPKKLCLQCVYVDGKYSFIFAISWRSLLKNLIFSVLFTFTINHFPFVKEQHRPKVANIIQLFYANLNIFVKFEYLTLIYDFNMYLEGHDLYWFKSCIAKLHRQDNWIICVTLQY